jgi:hypothetical protein
MKLALSVKWKVVIKSIKKYDRLGGISFRVLEKLKLLGFPTIYRVEGVRYRLLGASAKVLVIEHVFKKTEMMEFWNDGGERLQYELI